MIEIDLGVLIGGAVLVAQFAANAVGLWWVRHNIPDLWSTTKKLHDHIHQVENELRELIHQLDKDKLTRTMATRKKIHVPPTINE